jgi:hypothetical protein
MVHSLSVDINVCWICSCVSWQSLLQSLNPDIIGTKSSQPHITQLRNYRYYVQRHDTSIWRQIAIFPLLSLSHYITPVNWVFEQMARKKTHFVESASEAVIPWWPFLFEPIMDNIHITSQNECDLAHVLCTGQTWGIRIRYSYSNVFEYQ